MAKHDIFAPPIAWSDDAHQDAYTDVDGSVVPYTIDRVARLINNFMSGHHMLCGMDECDMIPDPMAFLTGHEVLVPRCLIEGPTTPELLERNRQIDAEIEAKMKREMPEAAAHFERKRVGFDTSRIQRNDAT